MATKKKAAAKTAKTKARKSAASPKRAVAAPKKAAAKKSAAKKSAPKKTAARKKAPATKRAAPRKQAAPRAGAAAESAPPEERPDRAPPAESAPAETAPDASSPAVPPAADGARAPREPMLRGRRRRLGDAPPGRRSGTREKRARRPIPPLPDDDDVPPAEGEPPAETPAAEVDPRAVLEAVRRGEMQARALTKLPDDAIRSLAREAGLKPRRGERTSETIYRLLNETPARAADKELKLVEGLLELHPDGYGFLRQPARNYSQHPEDVYVSAGLVRRLGLKPGHWITGRAHRPRSDQPYLALQSIEEVNHDNPDRAQTSVPFEKLTVVYPDTRFVLETVPEDIEMRVMDLFCPLGRGQRGLIVAPPRTGKTIMLQKLADAIATNSPDVDIVVLLVDERPEEVTNMRRSVRGEVVASTFDKPASNHVRVAELVMEKVKRMVEFGRHVVLLLDSITRMGRAYNNMTGGSGRILTGGLDANALTKPKRFFGSARNVEDGGSLTIVATALVDTGSRMDEVIFEEFKGTGNMELVLSRDMANARVWPAIDVPTSGTRNEDLLMHPDELRRVTLLRRGITGQDPQAVMLALRDQLKKNPTNAQFLMGLGN